MAKVKSANLQDKDKKILEDFFSGAPEYFLESINDAIEEGLDLVDLAKIIHLKQKSLASGDIEAWKKAISLESNLLKTLDGKRET